MQNKQLEQIKCLLTSQEEVLITKNCILKIESEQNAHSFEEISVTPFIFAVKELSNAIAKKRRASQEIHVAMNNIRLVLLKRQQVDLDEDNTKMGEMLDTFLEKNEQLIEQKNIENEQNEASIKCYLEIVEEFAKRLQEKEVLLDDQERDLLINEIGNDESLNTMLMENEAVSNYFMFLNIDFEFFTPFRPTSC
jgi:hypothetical protein